MNTFQLSRKKSKKWLKSFSKGASIIFLGIVLSKIFGFIYKFMLARYLGPADFGLFSLGLMVLGIATVFSLLGIHQGVKRFIAYYDAKRKKSEIKKVLWFSFFTIFPLSILLALIIISFSRFIAVTIFSKPEFVPILRVFAIMIPFLTGIRLFQEIFMGFEKSRMRALIEGFGDRFAPIIFVGIMMLLGGKLLDISWGHLIGLAVVNVVAIFFLRRIYKGIKGKRSGIYSKEMLKFSIPLLFANVMSLIFTWTDTFFIGVFMSSAAVGIYSALFSISDSLPMIKLSISAVFLPKATKSYSQGKFKKLLGQFKHARKRIVLFTLPLFLLVFIFAGQILGLIFGKAYTGGALALRILAAGMFFNLTLSPSEEMLQAIDKTKILAYTSFGSGLMNVILNLILIPSYGIEGAATATSLAIIAKSSANYLSFRSNFINNLKK